MRRDRIPSFCLRRPCVPPAFASCQTRGPTCPAFHFSGIRLQSRWHRGWAWMCLANAGEFESNRNAGICLKAGAERQEVPSGKDGPVCWRAGKRRRSRTRSRENGRQEKSCPAGGGRQGLAMPDRQLRLRVIPVAVERNRCCKESAHPLAHLHRHSSPKA